jgi:hypothetical protein
MKAERQKAEPDEASLVKLYMDLTGASESLARGVFMYTVPERSVATANGMAFKPLERPEPVEARSAKTSERRTRRELVTGILPRLSRPLTTVMAS